MKWLFVSFIVLSNSAAYGGGVIPFSFFTSNTPSCSTGSQTFDYTGSIQTLTVASGCTKLIVKAWGAGGNATTAGGAYAYGEISTSGGTTYAVVVGQRGLAAGNTGNSAYGCGGVGYGSAATGGGLSGVFTGSAEVTCDSTGQSRALIVAGAAGSNAQSGSGGPGGGASTTSGSTDAGGTANSGSFLKGGAGTNGLGSCGSGGGGYQGGPSGNCNGASIASGGGGSSYASGSGVANGSVTAGSTSAAGNSGDAARGTAGDPGSNGRVVISWQ